MPLGDAVSLAASRIVEPVEAMHHSVADRWFDRFAPASRPVRLAHDAISRVVYGSIRLGAVVGGLAVDASLADGAERGSRFEAVVAGLWGGSGLGMTLRDGRGEVLPGDLAGLPVSDRARGHIVVLVHGLVETERRWSGTPERPGFLDALAEHEDLTPVVVRYNTGLPVAANGARLSHLLDDLWQKWPVPVESIAMIGHSMGGLVVRAACSSGQDCGDPWVANLTDLVTIGAPHGGAPLARLADTAARRLRRLRSTAPLAAFLDRRSDGIRDMQSGPSGSAWPDHVRVHHVAGMITEDPAHPVGALVGDLMVRPASGLGSYDHEPTNAVVVGGAHHFDLPHNRAVIDMVLGWLRPD